MFSSLDSRLEKALDELQLTQLFPVQRSVLSRAYAGRFERDLCVSAPTGSGKTLAYMLPLIHILSKRTSTEKTLGLIVLPSSDLATQVCSVAGHFCAKVGVCVRVTGVRGTLPNCDSLRVSRRAPKRRFIRRMQATASHSKSQRSVPSTPQILVTTPGGLVAHRAAIETIEFLVIDEADKILQQSHQNFLATLNSGLQRRREVDSVFVGERHSNRLQILLCSATLKKTDLHMIRIFAPDQVRIYKSQVADLPSCISEFVVFSEAGDKFAALLSILKACSSSKMVILCASATRARHLYDQLHQIDSFTCFEYSSMASQQHRAQSLSAFQKCRRGILVATDAATRGLDVEGVSIVVSFDQAEHFQTYLHRAGRTGRAGNRGICVTTCSTGEDAKSFSNSFGRPGRLLSCHEANSLEPLACTI